MNHDSAPPHDPSRSPFRDSERDFFESLINAIETARSPRSRDEADVFRLAAQLLKTWYPSEAAVLDTSAELYFAMRHLPPGKFPEAIADGLISDVPRFRHTLQAMNPSVLYISTYGAYIAWSACSLVGDISTICADENRKRTSPDLDQARHT